jgi:uncharacterized membrane protein
MSKVEYLKILSDKLKKNGFDKNEIDEIIYDYEEHFTIGTENGKSEDEICISLGDTATIARQYKIDRVFQKAENNATTSNIVRAVFASLSLGFVNVIFVLGPFIGILGVLFGLFSAAVGITLGGFISLLAAIISPFTSMVNIGMNPLAAAFLSIGLTSLGLLFFIGDCYIAKYFFKGTIAYLKFNLKIISNRGE